MKSKINGQAKSPCFRSKGQNRRDRVRFWQGLGLVCCLGLAIAACSLFSPGQVERPVDTGGLVTEVVIKATHTPLQPAAAGLTPQPSPTVTETPTEIPTPTATLHPMSILGERQIPYPGSEITIEAELDPGANYRRYYASYRSEGLKIYALLTIPDGEQPDSGWPAIVFNHGYIPPNQYRTTERYIAYVDRLARSGYVVFRIDYRGHDQSEGVATGAYNHPGYTADVLNAVSAIRRYPPVDPERVGMWGHSMGGFLTLRAMVISSEIKAGVIWGGVVGSYPDLLEHWQGQSPTGTSTPGARSGRGWRSGWMKENGTPEENPEFWAAVSANSYLEEISGPVQLHHGLADESVPPVLSEILSMQLQEAGKPVELYLYEGDNHNLSNQFNLAMKRTIEFYDRYLNPR